MTKTSKRKSKFEIARVTAEKVFALCASAYRRKNRVRFVLNPATGALELPIYFRAKVRKSLRREARRIQLRLYFRFLGLCLGKIALETRNAMLLTRCYLSGYVPDLASKGHGILSVPKNGIYANDRLLSSRGTSP